MNIIYINRQSSESECYEHWRLDSKPWRSRRSTYCVHKYVHKRVTWQF